MCDMECHAVPGQNALRKWMQGLLPDVAAMVIAVNIGNGLAVMTLKTLLGLWLNNKTKP